MKDRYVVDTNVLIAGSAAIDTDINATPTTPALRKQVWSWLDEFDSSSSHLVLDGRNGIFDEYCRKLGFNDYGRQVVLHKQSANAVDYVNVEYDRDGHAILAEPLNAIINDNADKKMVAAAVDAVLKNGTCAIAFASDTDWHRWEDEIVKTGVELEPIIEQWSRAKHDEKKAK